MKTYARRRSCGAGVGGASGGATVVSLDEVCRLCLAREDQLVPIFGENEAVPLALRIMACVSLEVLEDDGLPGMICRPCHYQLEKYYIFRKKCESSDIKLRMHLKQLTESTGVIDGNLDDDGDNDNSDFKCIKDEALVGASITIAIPEEGEGDMELDDNIHEIEDTNNITLPQNNPDDPRQACTLKRGLGLLSDKETAGLVLDEKEDDCLAKDEMMVHSKTSAIVQCLTPESNQYSTVDIKDEEHILTTEDPDSLSVRVFPSQGERTHVEVTTEDGSILLMELTTEEAEPLKNESGELLIFKCDHCPKTFSRMPELKRHHSIHSTRGITCLVCDKWFPSQSSYTRHERIHTGEKPFQCGVCQRCFAQKEILLRHLPVHSDVKPFNCTTCDKGFTQRDALKAHMLTHNSERHASPIHKCPLCTKRFCHASGLSRHILRHSGRTYRCAECPKIFSDKSSLKRHLRISGHQEKTSV